MERLNMSDGFDEVNSQRREAGINQHTKQLWGSLLIDFRVTRHHHLATFGHTVDAAANTATWHVPNDVATYT